MSYLDFFLGGDLEKTFPVPGGAHPLQAVRLPDIEAAPKAPACVGDGCAGAGNTRHEAAKVIQIRNADGSPYVEPPMLSAREDRARIDAEQAARIQPLIAAPTIPQQFLDRLSVAAGYGPGWVREPPFVKSEWGPGVYHAVAAIDTAQVDKLEKEFKERRQEGFGNTPSDFGLGVRSIYTRPGQTLNDTGRWVDVPKGNGGGDYPAGGGGGLFAGSGGKGGGTSNAAMAAALILVLALAAGEL